MSDENRNVPKIRFPGFADAWERRKISDLTSVAQFKPYLKEANDNGDYEVIQQGDKPVLGFSDGCPFMEYEKVTLFGDHTLSLYKPKAPFFLATDGLKILYSNEMDGQFYYYLLEKYKPESEGYKRHFSILKESECSYPSNKEEQYKIGSFFLSLDNLITLYQCKCEKIKKFKKYMHQKMFPKEGELAPEIRFPGFTDAWDQRKLGDIADVTKLAGFEFTEHVVYSEEGKIIALRGLNIKNGQLVLDDVKYIDGSNFSKLNRSKLYVDDIMFTYVGTVGEVAIINENDRFYLAPNVSRIRVQSNVSPKYISHYMRTDSFYRHIIFPLIATSSQPALSMENIRIFEIRLPSKREEQDRLSEFFDSIDNLITLQLHKLDSLKELKKSLLQQMFV